jgi:hypothetical protein
VCITKETTLKGIRVSDIQINCIYLGVKKCIFADQRSDSLWTDLVNWLVFITEVKIVYSAVRTGIFKQSGLRFVFKGLKCCQFVQNFYVRNYLK